jgi:hypothetical protein
MAADHSDHAMPCSQHAGTVGQVLAFSSLPQGIAIAISSSEYNYQRHVEREKDTTQGACFKLCWLTIRTSDSSMAKFTKAWVGNLAYDVDENILFEGMCAILCEDRCCPEI